MLTRTNNQVINKEDDFFTQIMRSSRKCCDSCKKYFQSQTEVIKNNYWRRKEHCPHCKVKISWPKPKNPTK